MNGDPVHVRHFATVPPFIIQADVFNLYRSFDDIFHSPLTPFVNVLWIISESDINRCVDEELSPRHGVGDPAAVAREVERTIKDDARAQRRCFVRHDLERANHSGGRPVRDDNPEGGVEQQDDDDEVDAGRRPDQRLESMAGAWQRRRRRRR